MLINRSNRKRNNMEGNLLRKNSIEGNLLNGMLEKLIKISIEKDILPFTQVMKKFKEESSQELVKRIIKNIF